MSERFRPVTIGITGGSASGKTTFARALAAALADLSPVILHQDHYFKDWSTYPPEVREHVRTANHPDAVRWEVLLRDIERLIARHPIEQLRQREGDDATIVPGDLLIVEGHLVLWDERIRERMDLKLYLDVDPHERVLRRLVRDVGESGGSLERAVAWYRRDVIPNFPLYTESCQRFADLVVPFDHENVIAMRAVAAWVLEQVEERRRGPERQD